MKTLNVKIYILSDNNTWKAAGEKVYHTLKGNHFDVSSTMIERDENILIPDEKAVGEMFMGLPADTGMIISVGSGTLNDMAKYMSSRTKFHTLSSAQLHPWMDMLHLVLL